MTTIPFMSQMRTFSQMTLTINFNTGGFGREDKNHQTIAVILRLHFAARVNNTIVNGIPCCVHRRLGSASVAISI